jgi:hypothetical protein
VSTTEWKEEKAFAEELKRQWRLLWRERIDDRNRAEGIADKDFSMLFVERGTIIMATRDFKPLDFKQILQQHKMAHATDMVLSNSTIGGWGRFAREVFGKNRKVRRQQPMAIAKSLNGALKKGGRGWLHARL